MSSNRLCVVLVRILVVVLAGVSLPRPSPSLAQTENIFYVGHTADSGAGSLRQAILDANARGNPYPALIVFNMPKTDVRYGANTPGVWTIYPQTALPNLTGGLITIDGGTQKTNQGITNPYGPSIEIQGTLLVANPIFSVTSGGNSIRGLALNHALIAVRIDGGVPSYADNDVSDNYIGTDATGGLAIPNQDGIYVAGGAKGTTIAHNEIAGNGQNGIHVVGAGTDGTRIYANYIGQAGRELPNGGHGIFVEDGPNGTLIGSEDVLDRNLIISNKANGVQLTGATQSKVIYNVMSDNDGDGIALDGGTTASQINLNQTDYNDGNGVWIAGSGTAGNSVQRNYIAGNGHHGVAVYDGAEQNVIGGPTAAAGNSIVDNNWSGVAIVNSNGNLIDNNQIGRDLTWHSDGHGNGYYGVGVVGGNSNIIGPGNLIVDNGLSTGSAGVWIDGLAAQKNQITQNSIFHNGGKGISLTGGANAGLLPPTITQANCQGVLGSGPAHSRIEIFSDDGDEGRLYEGWTRSSPLLGAISRKGPFNGPQLTVTAIDEDTGNTTEFSTPVVGACLNEFLPTIRR